MLAIYVFCHSFVAIVLAQVLPDLGIPDGDLVECYLSTDNCTGTCRNTTYAECCDNRGKDPADFEFSVQTDDEGFRRCPIS